MERTPAERGESVSISRARIAQPRQDEIPVGRFQRATTHTQTCSKLRDCGGLPSDVQGDAYDMRHCAPLRLRPCLCGLVEEIRVPLAVTDFWERSPSDRVSRSAEQVIHRNTKRVGDAFNGSNLRVLALSEFERCKCPLTNFRLRNQFRLRHAEFGSARRDALSKNGRRRPRLSVHAPNDTSLMGCGQAHAFRACTPLVTWRRCISAENR